MQIPPSETYMGLQRGVGDVFFGPLSTAVASKLREVSQEVAVIPGQVSMSVLWMNWDVWEDLPEAVQAALEDETGRAMNIRCGQVLKAAVEEDIKTVINAG